MTGPIRVPFCWYVDAIVSTNTGSGVRTSLMKKFQNLRASRRPVSGCVASALIRSMPSWMPADSLRDGIVRSPLA